MSDNKHLARTLLGVYQFYGQELSEFALRVWTDALRNISPEVIDEAFSRHLRDPKHGAFLPKPADVMRQLRGNVEDEALVEWGKVLEAARAGGKLFTGPTQAAIDALGGMAVLRRSNEDQHAFMQKRFMDAFAAYQRREEAPPLLSREAVALLERAKASVA